MGNMDHFATKSLEKLKSRLEVREKVEMSDLGEVVKPRLFELMKSSDHQDRVKGARLFMETGSTSDLPRLVDLLAAEEHEYVIATLVKAIGALADDETYMDILIKYLKHENSRVRANTIEALGFFESERVFREIAPFIRERNNRVKANVAKILWRYSIEKTLRYLKDMLDSEDLWSCYSAVFALAEIGHYKTRALLMYALLNSNVAIRLRAAKALHEMDMALSDDVSQLVLSLEDRRKYAIPTRVINYQVRLLASQAPRERGAGARILHHIAEPGDRNVIQALKDLISRETDESVLGPALMAYLRVGRRDALQEVEEFLQNPNPRIRADVVEGLSDFDDPAVLDLAVPSLSDSSSRVRANAARVMWRFSAKRTMEYILGMLRSKDQTQMKSAIFILGEIGAEETREILLKLLAETQGELNEFVGEALIRVNRKLFRRSRFRGEQKGRLSLPVTEDPVKFINKNINLLVDTDFTVRRRAVELLNSAMGDETFDVFRKRLLSEENPFIKATLVKIVSRQGGDEAVDLLRDFLRDNDSRVRSNCVEALGEIRSSSVIGLITPMLNDPSSRVRESAAVVVWKISENRDFDRLKQMVDDLRGALQTTARETLMKRGSEPETQDAETFIDQDSVETGSWDEMEEKDSGNQSDQSSADEVSPGMAAYDFTRDPLKAETDQDSEDDKEQSDQDRQAPGPKSSAYEDIMTDMNTKMDHLVGPDTERGISGRPVVNDDLFSGGVTPKVRKLYKKMAAEQQGARPETATDKAGVEKTASRKETRSVNWIPWTVAVIVMIVNLIGTYVIISKMGDNSPQTTNGPGIESAGKSSSASASSSGAQGTAGKSAAKNGNSVSGAVEKVNPSAAAEGNSGPGGETSSVSGESGSQAVGQSEGSPTDSGEDDQVSAADKARIEKLVEQAFREYEQHFDIGDLRNARASLEKILSLDRTNGRARYLLAVSYAQEGRLPEAETEYRRILDQDPENSDALFGLANTLVGLSREQDALDTLDKLLEKNSNDTPSLILSGKILLSSGNAAEARERFNRAYDLLASLEALELRASAGMALLRWQEALADYKLIASKAPGSASGFMGMARVYIVLKWLTQALENSSKALELEPDNQEAMVVQGLVLSALGRTDEARQFAEKALASGYDSAQAYEILGEAAASQMRYPDAINFYQEALARAPSEAKYYYQIGKCQEDARDFESALSSYTSGLRLLEGTGQELEGVLRARVVELEQSTSAGARPVVKPAAPTGPASGTQQTPAGTSGRGNRDKYGRGL